MAPDTTLLRQYLEDRSEDAFSELVGRHLNLVYFTALRRVQGDTLLAQDVTQTVFALLARKGARLLGHPTLTGWLYTAALNTARDAVRAETRRRRREETAHVMDANLRPSAQDPDWDHVRPVIDDALGDLSPADRDALLLRFFQNRRFAEIADTLRTSENAARMRTERALDRLRAALARRGVTSTGAALTAALGVPASAAMPATLVQQISTGALLGAAAGTAGIVTSLISFMSSAKITALATATTVLAIGLAVHGQRQLTSSRAELAAAGSRLTQQRALIENLEWRLASANERQARAQSGGMTSPTAGTSSDLAAPPNPVTRDQVEARLAKAKEFAQSGRRADALREYLWCYDVGMRQVEGYFLMRYSAVLDAIGELAKSDPSAADALRQRRDAAKARLLASPTDMEAGKDFAQINRVLGDNDATFALFDSFAEDDPRRGHLIDMNMGRLMDAQRYREFAKAMPYGNFPQVWEQMTEAARSPALDELRRTQAMQQIVGFAAAQIEMRAGAGDPVSASDLIERLLVFDNSPQTIAEIKRRLQRAGHPELFTGP